MNRGWALGLCLIAVAALALRCARLDNRPMHNDEAVNALKLGGYWSTNHFRYDPNEHHGPTLYYSSLPSVWLSSTHSYHDLSETTMRLTPALFGVGLVILVWLLRDGLGRGGMLAAAGLTALSPALVFYSRYYIHESLLACFTMLTLAGGWRYTRGRGVGWAILAGVGLGLMYATKETFVFSVAAMAAGLVLTAGMDGGLTGVRRLGTACKGAHWVAALLAAGVVSGLLFTSFGTNWSGPLDSVRTYLPWLKRAGGDSPHIHPWYFYFERLAWFQRPRGFVWSEGLILILGLAGMVASLRRVPSVGQASSLSPTSEQRTSCEANVTLPQGQQAAKQGDESGDRLEACPTGRITASPCGPTASRRSRKGFRLSDADPRLARFLTFYTLALTGIYSAISYKTPWCLVTFLHGWILLAGIGVTVLFDLCRPRWAKAVLGVVLLAATAHLGWQCWQASFVRFADWRNPYVYAQTVPDVLRLAQRIEELTSAHPARERMLVKVMAPGDDYWPLPYYLRRLSQVGWYEAVPEDPFAPVVVTASKLGAALDERSDKRWLQVGLYQLRPRVFLELYVELELWKRWLETRPKPAPDEDE